MFRTLTILTLLFGLGCVDSQDHGMRDDAGSDAFVDPDTAVAMDAGAEDAAEDSTIAADATPDPDGGASDSGVRAAFVTIVSDISHSTWVDLIGGALVPRPHTRFGVRVSAGNTDPTRRLNPPAKTVGPCDYWPPEPTATWPPGVRTPGESVPLALDDVTVRVDGSIAELTESTGSIVASHDYVPGARIDVTVRLATGVIRRSFEIDPIPVVNEPAHAAGIDGFEGEYIQGSPFAIRWPTTYAATDRQSILITGGDNPLWASCTLEHGDGEIVFPWADVNADFIGAPDGANSINVVWNAYGEERAEEAGVEVRVGHSRLMQILTYSDVDEL